MGVGVRQRPILTDAIAKKNPAQPDVGVRQTPSERLRCDPAAVACRGALGGKRLSRCGRECFLVQWGRAGVFRIASLWKPKMKVHVLPSGPIQTNAYLLVHSGLGQAVLIDAPEGVWALVEPVLAENQCRLAELWLTHGHWDHIQGAAEVVRSTRAKVRAHPADQPLIETPDVQLPFLEPGAAIEPINVDFWTEPPASISVFSGTVEVRHVPGHCPGSLLFYLADKGLAFVGDAIFAGSVGRTDLIGGSFEQLERSIRRQIYTLPASTVLCPGHGPQTTVGEEMAHNPYVPALA